MKWISVEDKLPQSHEEVMIWPIINSYGERRTAWIGMDGDWLYALETEHVCDDFKVETEITHWMPLPKPPEDSR